MKKRRIILGKNEKRKKKKHVRNGKKKHVYSLSHNDYKLKCI